MDPLQLLRDYKVRDELSKVVLSESSVDFGDRYTFPRHAVTSYKSQKGQRENYSLDTVLFFLQNLSAGHGTYMQMAREAKINIISMIDREDLLNYLTGVTDTSQYIDLSSTERLGAALASEGTGQPSTKRHKGLDGSATETAAAEEAPLGVEHSILHEILAHERELRDRNSQLMTPNKNLSRVLEVIKANEREKQQRRKSMKPPGRHASSHDKHASKSREQRPREDPNPPSQKQGAIAAPLPIKPSGRFERSDMQQAAMVKDINTLGINPYGLHGQQQQRRQAEQAGPREEQPPPPPRPSSAFHQSSSRPQASSHAPTSSARPPSSSSSHRSVSGQAKSRIPIILVPAATSAKINMFNVKHFLEQGEYKTTEQCKAEGVQRVPLLSVKRTVDRKAPVMYYVTDKLPPKTSKDWKRVVAVFVHGAGWQFKDFPEPGAPKGDLVETFLKYQGIFLHYHNEDIPAVVKGWKVEKLSLHRDTRYNDPQTMRTIWRKIDSFLSAKNSQLSY